MLQVCTPHNITHPTTYTFQVLGALFVVDTLTGYQITALLELPEPYGIIVVWGLVLPTILVFATSLTNLVFKDNLILKVGW